MGGRQPLIDAGRERGDVSINRQDPVEGTLAGRLWVLGKDRHDKGPPAASDSMWGKKGNRGGEGPAS